MAGTSDTASSTTSASTTPMILTPDSTGTSPPVFIDSLPSSPLSGGADHPNSPSSSASTTSSPRPGPGPGPGQGHGQGHGQETVGMGTTTTAGNNKRRLTAYYSNTNLKSTTKTLKPFSRSAAKRESVLALGSIEHLQHYFTKTGLAAKRDPLDKPHYGLVPAIGGAAYTPASTSTTSVTSNASDGSNTPNSSPDPSALSSPPEPVLLPEPPLPRRLSLLLNPNQPKTYETDPESLLPGVVDDLNAVARAWEIDKDDDTPPTVMGKSGDPIVTVNAYDTTTPTATNPSGTKSPSRLGIVDVLDLLKTTTRAIRSTRNYLVSLPDESMLSPVTRRAHFRPTVLGPPDRPQSKTDPHPGHTASSVPGARTNGRDKDKNKEKRNRNRDADGGDGHHLVSNEKEDRTSLVRKSALEVLAALREVEERYRLPLSDEAYDAQSDSARRTQSPIPDIESSSFPGEDLHLDGRHTAQFGMNEGDLSVTYSLMPVQVGDRLEHVPVWEDEESESDFDEEKEKRELWDERLVLGSGWLYRQDVTMEEMGREREVVQKYLDVVDAVIFGDAVGEREEAEKTERAWERERRRILTKNLRPRSKGRRVSDGFGVDGGGSERTQSIAMVLEEGRRVSMGGAVDLPMMRLTEEPELEEMASAPSPVKSVSMGERRMGESVSERGRREGEEGEGSESVDDEDLPEWAKRGKFVGRDLDRAHAFLSAHLPSRLLPLLGPASSRTAFLESLSSGQLLCVAYNTCVRRSKKPWGYVSKESIHDVVELASAQAEMEVLTGGEGGSEGRCEGRRKGWTFRRTDNLRLWVGALKLRYLLPIQTPTQPLLVNQASLQLLGQLQSSFSNTGSPGSPGGGGGGGGILSLLSNNNNQGQSSHSSRLKNVSTMGPGSSGSYFTSGGHVPSSPGTSPTKIRFGSGDEPPIEFDARVVARKDGGWEGMLEEVLVRWMWKAVGEKIL